MKFTIVVNQAPATHQACHSAFQFTKAALELGHQVERVFFYRDGVNAGSDYTAPPQDETQHTQHWQQLAQKHNLDMVVCIAAALRRGVIDKGESERYEKSGFNLNTTFELSGLGQLIDGVIQSDRVVTFG